MFGIWVTALVVALAAPLLWLPLLRRWQVIDHPNARSSHHRPVIRGAGLAPATGIVAALLLVAVVRPDLAAAASVLGAALVGAALGLVEDLRGVPVSVRAAGQLVLGVAAGAVICAVLGRSGWPVLLVGLGYLVYLNCANFMDGIDGISGLHGLVAGVHYLLVGVVLQLEWLQLVALVVAAVFVGFLPWNLLGRKAFLGDVGSYLLGGAVVGCGAVVWLASGQLVLAIAPAAVYLADTGSTLIRRARAGEPVLQAHRSHTYQRLVDSGLTHGRVSLLVSALSVVCCAVALWSWTSGDSWVAVPVLVVVLGGYLLSPRLRAPRRASQAAARSHA